tara:strand:- start:353 stop:940 length:588 start_codon:yes stop_codon:yes gene_type:complete
MAIIQDAATGKTARVNLDNTLSVHSIAISEANRATDLGQSYNINSGLITLTNAAESGVIYFKSNENVNIHIDSIIVILGNTTGGVTTDSTRVRIYANPTTGTLISGAVAADIIQNRNLGATSALAADVYKGATGNTITNGDNLLESLLSPGNRVAFGLDLTLPKGKSIGVSLEPNDSNTSMKCMVAFNCHIEPIL